MNRYSRIFQALGLAVLVSLGASCSKAPNGTEEDANSVVITISTATLPSASTSAALVFSPIEAKRVRSASYTGQIRLPKDRLSVIGYVDETSGAGWYSLAYSSSRSGTSTQSLANSQSAIELNSYTTAVTLLALPFLASASDDDVWDNVALVSGLPEVAQLSDAIAKSVAAGMMPLNDPDTKEAYRAALQAALVVISDHYKQITQASSSASPAELPQVYGVGPLFTRVLRGEPNNLKFFWNEYVWKIDRPTTWVGVAYEIDTSQYSSQSQFALTDPYDERLAIKSAAPVAFTSIPSDWYPTSLLDFALSFVTNKITDSLNLFDESGEMHLPDNKPGAYVVELYSCPFKITGIPLTWPNNQEERSRDLEFIRNNALYAAAPVATSCASSALFISNKLASTIAASSDDSCIRSKGTAIRDLVQHAMSGFTNEMLKSDAVGSELAREWIRAALSSGVSTIADTFISCTPSATLKKAKLLYKRSLLGALENGASLGAVAAWEIATSNIGPVEIYYDIFKYPWVEFRLQINGGGSVRVEVNDQVVQTCTQGCLFNARAGDTVTLVAQPTSGSTFGGWSGDTSGQQDTLSLTVSGEKPSITIAAAFASNGSPSWSTDRSSIPFSGTVGGSAPASKTFTLTNTGNGSGSYSISDNASWLHVSPTSGSLNAGASTNITVSVDACTASGSSSGTITISGGGSTATVSVTRSCSAATAPSWSTDRSSIPFSGTVGGSAPASKTFTLTNTGNGSGSYSISDNASWLHVSPTSGSLNAGASTNITVSVDACTASGSSSGTITISGGGSTATVSVTRSCAGLTWTSRSSGTGNHITGVVYGGNGLFAATVAGGYIDTSSNGSSWTIHSSGETRAKYLQAITYGNGLYVAVGDGEAIVTSTNGTTWTVVQEYYSGRCSGVTYGAGKYVAVCGSSAKVSSDGATWNSWGFATTDTIHGVTYGNGVFIAVGDNGIIWSSTNGSAWSKRSYGSASALYDVAYGNGKFVAVGSDGAILTSSDGSNWTSQSSGTTEALLGVGYGNGLFVAVGLNGTILVSGNGSTWNLQSSSTTRDLYDATYGNGTFVVVGQSGTILTANP